jgi:hypothetical protein
LAIEHKIPRLQSLDVNHRHDATHHHGKLRQAAFIQLLVGSGASVAPNVTVLALICLMPPPEPID